MFGSIFHSFAIEIRITGELENFIESELVFEKYTGIKVF